jgi:hypothetical protein
MPEGRVWEWEIAMERSKIRLGGISDKSIYYREMQVMASLPLTQVPFRFMHSGYRRWCGPWWKFYLNPKNYYREVIKIWKRGRYGWCVEDTFSLDCYLALMFELTGLELQLWTFPGTHFIGWVDLLGYKFPFEEFFFWFVLSAITILSYYEFFDDNRK